MARRWAAPVAWAAVILALTSLPGAQVPEVELAYVDKLMHFALYGVLGVLTARAARPGARAWRPVAASVAGIALVGALDEWHQRLVPGRSADAADWLADVAGATVGVLAAARVLALRDSQSNA